MAPGFLICISSLVSIALAVAGASVVATDGDSKVLPLLQRNVVANGVASSVSVRELKWGDDGVMSSLCPPCFDYVLATDVVYPCGGSDYFEPLLQSMLAASGTQTEILLAHENRSGEDASFFPLFSTMYAFSAVPQECMHPDWSTPDIDIIRAKRR